MRSSSILRSSEGHLLWNKTIIRHLKYIK
jgi:hypothetical protein